VVVRSALANWNHVVDGCSHSVGARDVGVDSNVAYPTSPIITFRNLAEVVLALVVGELPSGVIASAVGVLPSEQFAFWMDGWAGLMTWHHNRFIAISTNVFFEVGSFLFSVIINLHHADNLTLSITLVTAIATVAMTNEKGVANFTGLRLFVFCHVSTI